MATKVVHNVYIVYYYVNYSLHYFSMDCRGCTNLDCSCSLLNRTIDKTNRVSYSWTLNSGT